MASESAGMANAVIALQKYTRAFVARNRFLKLRRGVIKLQAMVRGFIVRVKFRKTKTSAVVIQKGYRKHRNTKTERLDLINIKKATKVIQNEWRRWKFRQGIECTY